MIRTGLPLAAVAAALTLVGGCATTTGGGGLGVGPGQLAPPGAPPGTCWDNVATPAIIETVTEQVEVAPASYNLDGSLYRAAQYRTEVRQVIVQERTERWFRTPCPEELTPEFIATVQRALAARGAYRGEITGRMDRATRAAIRAWQAARGTDSDTLSLDTARELGLSEVPG